MKNAALGETALIGREKELDILRNFFHKAIDGKGSTVHLSGETGIGKTRVVDELKRDILAENVNVLSGVALSTALHPFQIFSKALESLTNEPLFEEQEHISFTEIFAVNSAGILLGKASCEDGLDGDIFAGMLSAVQDFVRDSFCQTGEARVGLGRLEYGDMKILIEHGKHLFLTAVFNGNEHQDMKSYLINTLQKIENEHGTEIEKWNGKVSEMEPVQKEIMKLAGIKFLVRKDLEGVKLENERLKMADKVLEYIVNLSDEKPLVLLLEDLHWADESSLFVLNYLARNIMDRPVMILGTSRPKESQSLDNTIERMRSEGSIIEFPLKKLGKADLSGIIDSVCPNNDFPADFYDVLAERCGGTPLFVIEFLKHMTAEGCIEEKDGNHLLVNENYSIPDTVEEVIHGRLAGLEPGTMTIAEYASCIGSVFGIDQAMSICTIDDPGSALLELQKTGIINRQNGIAEFCHVIYQDMIYSTISPRWKTVYHKNIGEYFENNHKENIDDVIYELAKHFSLTNEYSKAFNYCYRAGEKAESSFAPEHAIGFYRNAEKMVRKMPALDSTEESRIELLMRIGDLQALVGDLDDAIEVFSGIMVMIADQLKKASIHRRIAEVLEKKGEFMKMKDECNKGLALLQGENGTEVARLMKLKGTSQQRLGNKAEARQLYLRSLDIAGKLGDDKEAAAANHSLGTLCWHLGDYSEALRHLEMAIKEWERLDDFYGKARSQANMGFIFNDIGDLDKALNTYESSMVIFKKVGDRRAIGMMFTSIGLIHYEKGDLEKSIRFNKDGLEIKKRIGDLHGIAISLNNLGITCQDMGNLEKALRYHEESLVLSEKIGDRSGQAMSYNNIALVKRDSGDIDGALENNRKGLTIAREIGVTRIHIHNQYGLAEAQLAKGDINGAIVNAEEALAISRNVGSKIEQSMGLTILAQVHRASGENSLAIQELKDAQILAGQSISKSTTAKITYETALCLMLEKDLTGAITALNKAKKSFIEMGMQLWTERCNKALGDITS